MKETYNVILKFNGYGVLEFPIKSRWLKGEEYGFLLRHYNVYSVFLNIFDTLEKKQPDSVYENPDRKYLSQNN
jgi:hypothetical protein